MRKRVGLGAIILGLTGCGSRGDPLYVDVPKGIQVSGVSCDPNVNVTAPAPMFQDIDGDGKNDIVYALMVKEDYPRWETYNFVTDESYEIYFRRNLGNGEFAKPKFLHRTIYEPSGIETVMDFKEVPR